MVRIKEIFTSIQGEGPFIGYKQLFIRFCGCNLNCKYCDTDFNVNNSNEYNVNEIIDICNNNLDCHSVSLTGGEPLLNIEFLKEFAPHSPLKIYLETNATLSKQLQEIIYYIDYVSADIKLPSCSGNNSLWETHEKFFDIASKKLLFAKVVFDNSINDIEIVKICNLCKKYNLELILQPMMKNNKLSVSTDFIINILDRCLKQYNRVRLIPQVHKFLDII